MTVPVIKSLVHQNPECKVTVLSRPFFKPLFDDISNVSFIAIDVNQKHKGFWGLFRLFKELHKYRFTEIADLHNVLRSKILRFFFKLNGYPVRFIDKGRAEKKALTREKNKVFKPLKSTHERYADVFRLLGFKVDLKKGNTYIKKELSEEITTVLGAKNKPWVGIAPFAAFKGKTYPSKLMKIVLEELSKKDITIFLFGGKGDIKPLQELKKNNQNIKIVAGKFSFTQELNLIENLDVMVSMDSGNAHLAALKNVATITLWGVTHPYAGFAPFNQPNKYALLPDLKKYPKIPCSVYGNTVFKGYENVMETIAPKEIVNTINEIVKKEP